MQGGSELHWQQWLCPVCCLQQTLCPIPEAHGSASAGHDGSKLLCSSEVTLDVFAVPLPAIHLHEGGRWVSQHFPARSRHVAHCYTWMCCCDLGFLHHDLGVSVASPPAVPVLLQLCFTAVHQRRADSWGGTAASPEPSAALPAQDSGIAIPQLHHGVRGSRPQ